MERNYNDISNIQVGIPALPEEYIKKLYYFRKSNKIPFLEWLVKEGEWVKEKQVIAKYNITNFHSSEFGKTANGNIVSPYEGIITMINNIEATDWNWEIDHDGDNLNYKRSYKTPSKLSDNQILFKIRLLKDAAKGVDTPTDSLFFENFNHKLNKATHEAYWELKDYAYLSKKPSLIAKVTKGINNSPFENPYDFSAKILHQVIPKVENLS